MTPAQLDAAAKYNAAQAHFRARQGMKAGDPSLVELAVTTQQLTQDPSFGLPALVMDGKIGPKTAGVIGTLISRARGGAGGTLDQNLGAMWDELVTVGGAPATPPPKGAPPAATPSQPNTPVPASPAPKAKKAGGSVWPWVVVALGVGGTLWAAS